MITMTDSCEAGLFKRRHRRRARMAYVLADALRCVRCFAALDSPRSAPAAHSPTGVNPNRRKRGEVCGCSRHPACGVAVRRPSGERSASASLMSEGRFASNGAGPAGPGAVSQLSITVKGVNRCLA